MVVYINEINERVESSYFSKKQCLIIDKIGNKLFNEYAQLDIWVKHSVEEKKKIEWTQWNNSIKILMEIWLYF